MQWLKYWILWSSLLNNLSNMIIDDCLFAICLKRLLIFFYDSSVILLCFNFTNYVILKLSFRTLSKVLGIYVYRWKGLALERLSKDTLKEEKVAGINSRERNLATFAICFLATIDFVSYLVTFNSSDFYFFFKKKKIFFLFFS